MGTLHQHFRNNASVQEKFLNQIQDRLSPNKGEEIERKGRSEEGV
jgi:hypothetical protein